MSRADGLLLLTGATGLVGLEVLRRLLRERPALRVVALVRDAQRWRELSASLGPHSDRVNAIVGDLRAPGLGLRADTRARLAAEVSRVIHAAADTRFSQPRAEAEAGNVAGTRHLLDLAAGWPRLHGITYVSTAFVAGTDTGRIEEAASRATAWVNAYEWSKHECEKLVRGAGMPWAIARPSTIVCDHTHGTVTQLNAIHRSLRLYHHGLAPMIPGNAASTIDVVTTDHVATGIVRLALSEPDAGRTVHLCAGAGAISLRELLDITHGFWSESPAWRRRGVTRPALTDLPTYRLFERTVEEAGDERLKQVTRSLSHFVPQLAYPKTFATECADALVGAAPPVHTYWRAMLAHLSASRWTPQPRVAA